MYYNLKSALWKGFSDKNCQFITIKIRERTPEDFIFLFLKKEKPFQFKNKVSKADYNYKPPALFAGHCRLSVKDMRRAFLWKHCDQKKALYAIWTV